MECATHVVTCCTTCCSWLMSRLATTSCRADSTCRWVGRGAGQQGSGWGQARVHRPAVQKHGAGRQAGVGGSKFLPGQAAVLCTSPSQHLSQLHHQRQCKHQPTHLLGLRGDGHVCFGRLLPLHSDGHRRCRSRSCRCRQSSRRGCTSGRGSGWGGCSGRQGCTGGRGSGWGGCSGRLWHQRAGCPRGSCTG